MSDQLSKPCKSSESKVISNLFLMCYYHFCIVVHSYNLSGTTSLLSTKPVLCNHKYT